MDSSGRQPLIELRDDDVVQLTADALAAGRPRHALAWFRRRAGGRSRPVVSRRLSDVAADRFAMHARQAGDFTVRASGSMEREDRIDFGHREAIRHRSGSFSK